MKSFLVWRFALLTTLIVKISVMHSWFGAIPQEFVSGTLYGIPYLGNYSGEQYEWRALLQGATLDTAQLSTAPDSVIQALKDLLQLPAETSTPDLLEQLHDRGMRNWHTIVWGDPIFGQTADHSYNVVLHPVVADWKDAKEGEWFNENITVGLFEPQNIQQSTRTPLLLNQFQTVNVNYHAPEHFSPDNARIVIDDIAPESSFWLIAVRQDDDGTIKSPINISKHIILHDNQQEEDKLNDQLQALTIASQPNL